MWFQVDLIILTALFVLIFKFSGEKELIIYPCILFALVFQYSELNYKLFNPLRYELKYPLGRFCEMIPYAAIGFLCSYHRVYDRLRENRLYYLILFGLSSLFLFKYSVVNSALGFVYSQNNSILLSFFVVGFAYLLPFQKLGHKVKKIIKVITRYTLGIYCMHLLLAIFLNLVFQKVGLNIDGFVLGLITYIVAFFISFMMTKTPVKYFNYLVN